MWLLSGCAAVGLAVRFERVLRAAISLPSADPGRQG